MVEIQEKLPEIIEKASEVSDVIRETQAQLNDLNRSVLWLFFWSKEEKTQNQEKLRQRIHSEEEKMKDWWIWSMLRWLKLQVFKTIWKIGWLDLENPSSQESPDRSEQERLTENLKVEEQYIKQKAQEYWITDPQQIAYILATVQWESWFKNIKEVWWENKKYWQPDPETWQRYYWRWFVQLTHKGNYKKFNEIIKDPKIIREYKTDKFKDNNWNRLTLDKIDLVNDPDVILRSNDLAAFILIYWMKHGSFTWKKLDDFINWDQTNFYQARSIINWMSSNPRWYQQRAENYLQNIDTSTA